MDCYNIFLDESGSADPKSYHHSPYFSLCGVLISDNNRDKLKTDLEDLKQKYFNSKKYILHSSELRYQLKMRNKSLHNFVYDLKNVFNNCQFSLLYVVVDKSKAYKQGWDSIHIYKQTCTILLSNILKFLEAKKLKGQIFTEASNANQDIHLYNAFFHLIRRGIERLSITNKQARQRFTSFCFVTKPNNDSEEQLADLFGMYGRLSMDLKHKVRDLNDLDAFETLIFNYAQKRVFRGDKAKTAKKIKLYREINSFKIIP